jgi:hypothetical protein
MRYTNVVMSSLARLRSGIRAFAAAIGMRLAMLLLAGDAFFWGLLQQLEDKLPRRGAALVTSAVSA